MAEIGTASNGVLVMQCGLGDFHNLLYLTHGGTHQTLLWYENSGVVVNKFFYYFLKILSYINGQTSYVYFNMQKKKKKGDAWCFSSLTKVNSTLWSWVSYLDTPNSLSQIHNYVCEY